MTAMDKLFELYNEYFDRLEQSVHRLNDFYPEPVDFPLRRKSREQFEAYLASGVESASKRLWLRRVLNDHDELLPLLPKHVQSLARRAA